ncbi:MAG: Holliday junction branch migration protein RuvA [Spirochaetes bacterium]|nr:MAG: Holliday junction branch migration protein RuvA [Spirochaetota bacterium]
MFNSISGIVTGKTKEKIFLQTNGIEWDILTTEKSLNKLPETGEKAKVFTYLHHREDQLKLFGFSTSGERDLFFDLIKVEGLGPKLAVKILSRIEVEAFIEALDTDDIETLSSIPGLGKKTAQKIILKLKGKLHITVQPWQAAEEDIVKALTGMGFDKKISRNAVKRALKGIKANTLNKDELEKELFTRAIAIAGGKEI